MHRTAIAALLLAAAPALAQDTRVFNFANIGQSYSAAIFATDPDVGRRIISTRIVLNVAVAPGSDAAEFSTDLLLPIQVDAGGTSVVAYNGADLEWSGAGTFNLDETTTIHNGVLIATRFGAESFGVQGQILEGSRVEVTFEGETPLCPADIDDGTGSGTTDGAVTIDDLVFFLTSFEIGNVAADLDSDGDPTAGTPDGAVTIEDLIFFLIRFEQGC